MEARRRGPTRSLLGTRSTHRRPLTAAGPEATSFLSTTAPLSAPSGGLSLPYSSTLEGALGTSKAQRQERYPRKVNARTARVETTPPKVKGKHPHRSSRSA